MLLGMRSVVFTLWIPAFKITQRPVPEAELSAYCIESPGLTMIAFAGIFAVDFGAAPAIYPIGLAFGVPLFRLTLAVGTRTDDKMLRLAFGRIESAALLVYG